jgi:xanthine dehydrogenase YagR molybdenum-binding subunit
VSESVGQPIPRADAIAKVTGQATFAAEHNPEGLAYGVIVQSDVASGTLLHLDVRAARSSPGVLAILTPFDVEALPQGGKAGVKPPSGRVLSLLQEKDVHYNGAPIAVVVAESLDEATHAAALVRPKWSQEAPILDFEKAMTAAYPVDQPFAGGSPPTVVRGDVEAGVAAGEVHVEAVYTSPIETHNAMEPHATVAEWSGDELTLHDSTQHVYGVRRFVAKTLGISDDKVRVIAPFTGGAFGSKGSSWSHVVLAAMAARRVGRPVKIVLTRRQMFGLVGARPLCHQELHLSARRDGTLTAIRHKATTSTSFLEDWVEPCTIQTRMLYACPNVETSQRLVQLNVGTPTFNRGPGESSGTFALESAMDELAHQLDMDPIELRLKTYAEESPEDGKPWSSKSLRECYQRGADQFGWSRRPREPRSMREGDVFVGWGMGTGTYPSRRSRASATARLRDDGTVVIRAATHELGTGTYTILAQIAADALKIDVGRVRVELGDSDLPENPISAGSMTAASSGSAVLAAASALAAKLRDGGANPGEVEAHSEPAADAKSHAMHSFGAVFAEVRVDSLLGRIRVSRLVGAYGAGRILNERTARSQFLGGITYGLAMALTEDTVLDPRTGRYLNADLAEYLVPVNADVPEIEVLLLDERDPYVNPVGAKGIGEIGTTGVAAAIANAVWHATGVRVRDLPITLDKVLTG